jgi:hypothetical protein
VTFLRLSTIVLVFAVSVFPGAQTSFAQGLSDASLAVGTDWRRGYMGLGGNLGRAIVKRPHAKTVKPGKAERRPPRRSRAVTLAVYRANRDLPIFLIAQSLDHTGLNIALLRTRTRGP